MKWLIMIMMEMVLLFWSASNYWYSIKVLRVFYQDDGSQRERIFWDLQWQKTMNNLRCRLEEEEEKKTRNDDSNKTWKASETCDEIQDSVTNRFFNSKGQTQMLSMKKILILCLLVWSEKKYRQQCADLDPLLLFYWEN